MTSTAETARFARRVWRRRLVSVRPFAIAGAVVAVVAVAVYAVYFSSWLAASSVDVTGDSSGAISADDVLAAAHVDLGTPLARLDLGAIEANVAKLPAVADVSVSRSWPHTVTIDVTPREPLAAVMRGGAWWVMDDEGVAFGRTAKRDTSLPVVEVGEKAGPDALPEVAKVVAALPSDLLGDVRRLTAHSMDSIELRLKDKSLVRWGSADDTARKVQVLSVLLDQVKASVYDVSVPEQPTTRH